MNKFLKRGLSFFLTFAIVFSSALVGLGECDFSGLFTTMSKAADESEVIVTDNGEVAAYADNKSAVDNSFVYVEEGDLNCNGEVTYTIRLKGGIGVTGAVFAAVFDSAVLQIVEEKSGACTTSGANGNETNNVPGMFTKGMKYGTDNVYVVGNANTGETVKSKDVDYIKFTFKFIDTSVDSTDIAFFCSEFVGSIKVNKNDFQVVVGSVVLTPEIPDSGHIAGADWIVEKEATVYEPGVKYTVCSLCGKRVSDTEIPQLVCGKTTITGVKQVDSSLILNWSAVEGADEYAVYRRTTSAWKVIARVSSDITTFTDNDLVSDSEYYYIIRVENEAGASEYSNQVSFKYHVHKLSDWLIRVEPTCFEGGVKYKECDSCDYEETEAIAPLEHVYSSDWTIDVAPTCNEFGSKSRHCINCDDKIDVTAVDPTGHTMGEWVVKIEPTCTDSGVQVKKCNNCSHEETGTIAPLGHTYSTEWTIDLVPTCTEKGSKSHHCIVCDDKADVTEIEPAGHTMGEWVVKIEPTCTDSGVQVKKCNNCSHEETGTIAPLGHTYSTEWTIDLAPTCTEKGSKSHHCIVCDDKADVTEIEPNGHISSDWINDPSTCTQEGFSNRVCLVCSEILETKIIPANGHTVVIDEAVEPTCTEDGKTEGSHCSVCNVTFVEQETVPAKGHDSSDWIIAYDSTCSVDGFKYIECSVCALVLTIEAIPAKGHTEADWIVDADATCTVDGFKHKECPVCHETLAEESIPAFGHTLTDWIIDDRATCTKDGFKHKECVICYTVVESEIIVSTGHTEVVDAAVEATCTQPGKTEGSHCSVCKKVIVAQETIAANGHTEVVDAAVEATCTQPGKTEGSHCSVCSEIIVAQQSASAKGHTSSDWVIDTAATCTVEGSKHIECTVCNEVLETKVISAIGHTEIVDNAVEATCTQPGKTEGSHCSVCNVVFVAQEAIAPMGHVLSDWILDFDATCKTDGQKYKICTVCNEIVDVEVIPAFGHSLTGWIIDERVTCTTDGLKHKECILCDSVVETEVIVSNGHTEVVDVAVAPTCTATGKTEGKHCSVCSTVLVAQQTVAALGHTEENDVAVAATCTTDGKTAGKHCSVCNAVLVAQQIVPATGHKVSDWKYNEQIRTEYKECTVCKTILETKYIPLATTTITSCYNEVQGVQLKWNAVPEAKSYKVYYKQPTQKDWKLVTTTTKLEYLDDAVSGDKIYQYAIKAVDQYGNESDYSAQRECRFIETPTLLTRENAVGGVKITWEKVAGATSYRIYRRGAGTDYWYYLGDVSASQNTFFDKESSLVSSGNYYRYTVRASYSGKDSAGKDYLIYSGFDTNGLYLKYVATPKLTSISNAAGGLQIKWNAVNGNGRMEYRVYRRGAGSTYWKYLGTTTSTTWTDAEVKNASGSYYRYTVRAVQGTNGSGWYSAFDTTGLYLMRLANPTLKSATSAKAGITVKWSSVKGATYYNVYRKTGSSSWTKIATVSGNANVSYLDKTAKKGTTYTYTVRAGYGSTTSYFNSGVSCKDLY